MRGLIFIALSLLVIASWLPACGEGDGAFFGTGSDLSDTSDQSDTSDTSEGDSESGVDSDTGSDTDTSPPEGCEGVLSFPDASLEFVIREAIDKPDGDIFYSDVAGITTITASDAD